MNRENDTDAKRVLIIDDDPDIRKLFSAFLKSDGWTVDSAASAEEGLRLVETTCYDLITLDRCMPGMDGLAFHYQLARHFGHGECFQRNLPPLLPPILIISGMDDEEGLQELMFGERVVGILDKPVEYETLISQTRELMTWEKQRRSLRRSQLRKISSRLQAV